MLVISYAPLRLGNTQKGHPRWLQNAAQMRRAGGISQRSAVLMPFSPALCGLDAEAGDAARTINSRREAPAHASEPSSP
jgi:hypothetical protein